MLQTLTYSQRKTVQKALDLLGLALADHSHTWTQEQRSYYEKATLILDVPYSSLWATD